MTGQSGPKFDPAAAGPSEDMAWRMISTLLAGPIVWGGIGALVDNLVNTSRVFLPIGVTVGFITSFYIVYVRFGRSTELEQGEK
jgi:ATP synthase protein I